MQGIDFTSPKMVIFEKQFLLVPRVLFHHPYFFPKYFFQVMYSANHDSRQAYISARESEWSVNYFFSYFG